jgi:hypothetical protein
MPADADTRGMNCMNAVDTNILVYFVDRDEPVKCANEGQKSAQFPFSFRVLLILLMMWWCDSTVSGQGPGKIEKTSSEKASVDGKKLIDALASKNRPPTIDADKPTAIFGKDYNWADRDRILGVLQRLVDHAEEVWPELVAHLDDKRYCITFETDPGSDNLSVGDVCRRIISDYLSEAYWRLLPEDSEVAQRRLSEPEAVCRERAVVKAWCQERSKKTLCELQIEICEWAIPAVNGLRDVSDGEKRASVAAIKQQIESLHTSRKALKVKNFFEHIREVWTLSGPEPAEGTPPYAVDKETEEERRERERFDREYEKGGGTGMF